MADSREQHMEGKREENQSGTEEVAALLSTLPTQPGLIEPLVYQYKGFWFSASRIAGILAMHQHFQPRDTDFLLATIRKVGTTWLKALAISIVGRKEGSFSDHPLLTSNPHIILPMLENRECQIPDFSNLPSPGLFATHVPYTLVPDSVKNSGCKIFFMCRNPKDTLVSMWKFYSRIRPKELGSLTLETTFEAFCCGYSDYGPFWDHVLGYWRASREHPEKVLFMKYEELKEDTRFQVKRLAQFLGLPFSLEEERGGVVDQVIELCSFEKISNLEVNKNGVFPHAKREFPNNLFFRKGSVGDWANHLTQEMVERLNSITEEKLKGSGLTFDEIIKIIY